MTVYRERINATDNKKTHTEFQLYHSKYITLLRNINIKWCSRLYSKQNIEKKENNNHQLDILFPSSQNYRRYN